LVERLAHDVAKLDTLRPQFRIETVAWEIADRRDYARLMRFVRNGSDTSVGGATDTGQFAMALTPNLKRAFSSTLQLLQRRGRARLRVAPSVTAISGATGNVFLGQTRFIKVLRQQGANQIAQALALNIGYQLNVTPRGGDNGPVLLEVAPRVSTVDDVEPGSGLPTLGIREIDTTVRLLSGESVLLAGLDSDLMFDTRGKSLPARVLGHGSARRNSADQTSLLVLLSVQRVEGT
jgi:type II secretory pathway component GspD/PulD (secretin)